MSEGEHENHPGSRSVAGNLEIGTSIHYGAVCCALATAILLSMIWHNSLQSRITTGPSGVFVWNFVSYVINAGTEKQKSEILARADRVFYIGRRERAD